MGIFTKLDASAEICIIMSKSSLIYIFKLDKYPNMERPGICFALNGIISNAEIISKKSYSDVLSAFTDTEKNADTKIITNDHKDNYIINTGSCLDVYLNFISEYDNVHHKTFWPIMAPGIKKGESAVSVIFKNPHTDWLGIKVDLYFPVSFDRSIIPTCNTLALSNKYNYTQTVIFDKEFVGNRDILPDYTPFEKSIKKTVLPYNNFTLETACGYVTFGRKAYTVKDLVLECPIVYKFAIHNSDINDNVEVSRLFY